LPNLLRWVVKQQDLHLRSRQKIFKLLDPFRQSLSDLFLLQGHRFLLL
jgi:hypothetical protein